MLLFRHTGARRETGVAQRLRLVTLDYLFRGTVGLQQVCVMVDA